MNDKSETIRTGHLFLPRSWGGSLIKVVNLAKKRSLHSQGYEPPILAGTLT